MKQKINQLMDLIKRRKTLNKRVIEQASIQTVSQATLFGLLSGFLVCVLPAFLVFQLSILNSKVLVFLGLSIIIVAFTFIFHTVYYTVVKSKSRAIEGLNYRFLIIYDTVLYALFIIILLALISLV